MGRKKNKNSKNKGNKSPNKNTAIAKAKDQSQAGASTSRDKNNDIKESHTADDISISSNDPSTSQAESTSQAQADIPVAKGRVSKREQFERSRSGSSLNSNECENGQPLNMADLTDIAQNNSAASAELTEEALSMHTQLLEASPSHSTTHAPSLPSRLSPGPVEGEVGKRGSMLSHEDCESGVGTFSVQSEGTHRDDTFAEDQDVHPLIHADLDMDRQSSEMHKITQNFHQNQSGSAVTAGHVTTAVHNDLDTEPVKQSSGEKHSENSTQNVSQNDKNSDENCDNTNADDVVSEQALTSPQSEAKIEGKPPSGSLQRQTSSSGSAELSRTGQNSHTLSRSHSNGSDLALSGTLPQGLASSASSRTTPFSGTMSGTMSGTKTSTGMAFHSTYATDTDFAMSGTGTSQSFGEETADLEASGDVNVSPLLHSAGDRGDMNSSTGALSTIGDLPELSPDGGQVRASLDEAEEVDRRLSLDYDLGSSIESMGIIQPLKFTNRGLSLYDELQMVGDGGDSSVRSTPKKNRSNTASSVFSDKQQRDESLADTLGSLSEHAEIENQEQPNQVQPDEPTVESAKQDSQNLAHIVKEEENALSSSSVTSNHDVKSNSSSLKEEDGISNPDSITDDETSRSCGSKTLSHTSSENGRHSSNGKQTRGAGYNVYPEHVQSAPAILELQRLEEEEELRRLYRQLYNQHQHNDGTKTLDSTGDIRVIEIGNESESGSQRDVTPQEEVKSNDDKEMSFLEASEAVEEYRAQQYRNRGQNPPVEIDQLNNMYVDDQGELVNAEELTEADTSLNRSLVIEQSVDEILENREQVANTVASLNQEIKNLQEENRNLYNEMTMYRSSSKQYKNKSDSFENYLKSQRAQVKDMEIKIAEINSQRENVRNASSMTEHVLLLNTCIQVEPRTYDSQTQASVAIVNRACQSQAPDVQGYAFHKQTSTDDLPIPDEGQTRAEKTTRVADSSERKRDLAKASAVLDKILRQMNSIAGTSDAAEDPCLVEVLGDDKEPETVDKWRHLAMTPISTEPQVLRVQRSLAKAALEYEILNTKINKSMRDTDTKYEEINKQLERTNKDLQLSRDECHVWQCKYEGDRKEIEMLRDRTHAMEKELMLKQMDNDRLSDEVKVRTEVMESGDLVSREAMENVRQERNDTENKATKLEADNSKLHQELCSVQKSRGEDLEKINALESTVSSLQADKAALEVELASLREEYRHLQKGISSVEKLFQLRPAETTDSSENFHQNAEKQIEELKHHVFEPKKQQTIESKEQKEPSPANSDVLASSTRSTQSVTSTNSNGSGSNSVHNEILKQSELILDILRENGDIEDEAALREVQLVNWQDVKNSITKHLRNETDEKVTAAVSESSTGNQSEAAEEDTLQEDSPTENSPTENNSFAKDSESEEAPIITEDIEVRSQLSELASALSSDLGIKVNLVVESPKQSFEPPVSESTPRALDKKTKQKMELEKMNRDYEELRKKRLALLVQAYTGKRDYKPSSGLRQPSFEAINLGNDAVHENRVGAMDEYDQQTEALRQRIHALREEIRQDRPTTYSSAYDSSSNGTANYIPLSRSYGYGTRTVLRQSKEELDSLLSKESRVPRVCIGGSSPGKSPRPSALRSPRSPTGTHSSNPYSFRPRRQIYPHKKDYVPRDEYYAQRQRQEDHYYPDDVSEEQYPERYADYQDEYSENGYDGYDAEGYENGDVEDEELYDEEQVRRESEAYYNQQKRINAKAIQKMRAKLVQNQKRISAEKAKLTQKQRPTYNSAYGSEQPDRYDVRYNGYKSRDQQPFKQEEKYKLPYSSSSKYPVTSSNYSDDKWAVKTSEEEKFRMSFHKEYPYEVDLVAGSNPPALPGYDPDKFDSSYFKFDTKYKPKQSDQFLVDKYISHEKREASPSPTYKVEVTSQVNTVPTVTSSVHSVTSKYQTETSTDKYSSTSTKYKPEPTYGKYSTTSNEYKSEPNRENDTQYSYGSSKYPSDPATSKYLDIVNKYKNTEPVTESKSYTKSQDTYKSHMDDSRKYSVENKENNYDYVNNSNVTLRRGNDYNRFLASESRFTEDPSDLTSYMDLPSKIMDRNSDKIASKLDAIDKKLSVDSKQKTETKSSGRTKYRSPYDKYDVTTENNVTKITPKDASRPADRGSSHYSTKGTEAAIESKATSGSHRSRSDKAKSKHGSDPKFEGAYGTRNAQDNLKTDVDGKRSKSSQRDSKALKSTSESRSRDSSPIRSYDKQLDRATEEPVSYKYSRDPSPHRNTDALANTKKHSSSKQDHKYTSRDDFAQPVERGSKSYKGDRYTSKNGGASEYVKPTRDVESSSKYAYASRETGDHYSRTAANDKSKQTEYRYKDPSPSRTYTDTKQYQSSGAKNKPYTSSKDYERSSEILLKEMEAKYKLPAPPGYRPSEPLHVKERKHDRPSKHEYKPSYTPVGSTNAVLNSKNLESLDRQNAEKMKREEADDRLKSRIISQKSITDDVSSIAGSSDTDFVVTGTGDILRRKSKTAKHLDRALNAELQMKSFETPYEQFEDEFYKQLDGGLGEEEEGSDDVDLAKESGDYWGEPKRHFGLKASNDTDTKYWSTPKPHAEKEKKTGSALLEDGFNSSLVDQKWYREAKEQLAQCPTFHEQKIKAAEQAIAQAKEKLRQPPDSPIKEPARKTYSKEQPVEKNPPGSSADILDDFENDKKIISELFEKNMNQLSEENTRAQRRVHWDTPHTKVKVMTPDTDQASVSACSDIVTQIYDGATPSGVYPVKEQIARFARTDFMDTVKEMKAASGLYEVPKLSQSDESLAKSSITSEISSVPTDPQKEEMYMPRTMEERQQIADTIIDKYTKDYDQETNKADTDDSVFHDSSPDELQRRAVDRDVSPKSSRIPVASPTRESSYRFPVASSTPNKSQSPEHRPINMSHSPERLSKSAIPIRSPSRDSKQRDTNFSYDISPSKEPRDLSRDSNKSRDISRKSYTSPTREANSAARIKELSPIRAPHYNTPPKLPPETLINTSPVRTKETHIPIRHGSDVEDRYRRDRSHSRDSEGELKTSQEMQEIINKYTGKSPQSANLK